MIAEPPLSLVASVYKVTDQNAGECTEDRDKGEQDLHSRTVRDAESERAWIQLTEEDCLAHLLGPTPTKRPFSWARRCAMVGLVPVQESLASPTRLASPPVIQSRA